MSANAYTIQDLLVGHNYNSRSTFGKIVSAEVDNRAVWYGENYTPFLVELDNGKFRTVAVKVSDY